MTQTQQRVRRFKNRRNDIAANNRLNRVLTERPFSFRGGGFMYYSKSMGTTSSVLNQIFFRGRDTKHI